MVGLRFLMPTHMLNWLNPRVFGPRVDLTATLLQVLGILFIGGTLFFIMPVVWAPNAPRKLAIAGLVLAWLLTVLVVAFGASRTGLGLSLERTNWALTTVGTVVFLLLSSTTLGFLRHSRPRIGLRTLVLVLLVVLAGAGLSVAQRARLRDPYAEIFGRYPTPDSYAPTPFAWQALLQIRAAYPEYNDLDDRTLARRIIAKYPVCRQTLEEVAVHFPTGVKTAVSRPRLRDIVARPGGRGAPECLGTARP